MSGKAFQDNVVILTGASSGIGREMALQLASQGAKIALAARREEMLKELAAECEALGGWVLVVSTDVSDEAQCKNLVERTAAEFGRVDTLINNAGVTMWAKFEEMEVLDPFEKVMRVNYLGSLYCTYYALPYLKESAGRIVVVSSMAGRTGVPFRSGYSASKFALAGFFETIRIELAEYGVSVTMTYPDFVKTDTRLQAFGPDGEKLDKRPLRKGKLMMTADKAAGLILKAAAKRKRELLMSARGKVGQWVKLIAPGIVDGVAKRAVRHN